MFYVKNGSMYLMDYDDDLRVADWTAFNDLAHGFKSRTSAERVVKKFRNVFAFYISKE